MIAKSQNLLFRTFSIMDSSSATGFPELGVVARAALDVWKVYTEAPPNLNALSGDIASLHIVLKELQWQTQGNVLGPNSDLQQELISLMRQCQLVVKDLEALVADDTVSYNTANSGPEEWSKEDILRVKARLVSITNLLIGFNSNITRYVVTVHVNILKTLPTEVDRYHQKLKLIMTGSLR